MSIPRRMARPGRGNRENRATGHLLRLLLSVMVLLCAAGAAQAQKMIGVNLNGDAADASGNYGIYAHGPSNLGPSDFVHGQDHWNNIANNLGWGGNEGNNTQEIRDSRGNLAGTVFISSDAGGGPLPGSRYDGTPVSAFPDPTGNLTNVLYNGIDFNQNHGVIKLVLTGASPVYDLYIFGSGGSITVTDTTHSKSYTSTNSLGTFAAPGIVQVTLDATDGTTTYTFGDHGNWTYDPPWTAGQAPMLSAFQLVEQLPPIRGTLLIAR